MGTSKKQKKREWLRYRDFVLSPYGVIKIKSLGYSANQTDLKRSLTSINKRQHSFIVNVRHIIT
ncbi:hypothetical protein [Symbiopectobacterium sp. RP]|uniref:hypothetical protein n=1 Tax=Symbiopectobacterium sp. RP TaxID=3248553 RepID=UPI003D2D5B92